MAEQTDDAIHFIQDFVATKGYPDARAMRAILLVEDGDPNVKTISDQWLLELVQAALDRAASLRSQLDEAREIIAQQLDECARREVIRAAIDGREPEIKGWLAVARDFLAKTEMK